MPPGDHAPAAATSRAAATGHPRVLDWADFEARLGHRQPAVFLDFDGTLTPIVARPEAAELSAEMRTVLARLAGLCPVAVISGRARADVAHRVGLDNVVYAGDHGFDIAGPGVALVPEVVDEGVAEQIRDVGSRLEASLAAVPGAIVEIKRFSIAIHYRLVAPAQVPMVTAAVTHALARAPGLLRDGGKEVFEIRPDVPWDKGRAVLWLRDALDLEAENVVPVYIGDDTTDEDAFHALVDQGLTILVSGEPQKSFAVYRVESPDQVLGFLGRLADYVQSMTGSAGP